MAVPTFDVWMPGLASLVYHQATKVARISLEKYDQSNLLFHTGPRSVLHTRKDTSIYIKQMLVMILFIRLQ